MNDQNKQHDVGTERKRVILMRGLPSSGKSWTARQIAKQCNGEVFEFVWELKRLPEARRQHVERVREAIEAGASPIVVDDDHRPGITAKAITAYAMLNNYAVEFAEPESTWWKAITPLLAAKEQNGLALARWARKLCVLNRSTHRVQLGTLVTRIRNWNQDLSPLDLLTWGETPLNEDAEGQEVAA